MSWYGKRTSSNLNIHSLYYILLCFPGKPLQHFEVVDGRNSQLHGQRCRKHRMAHFLSSSRHLNASQHLSRSLSSLLAYRTLFSSWNSSLYLVHTNQPVFSCENFGSEPEVFEMQRRESEYGHRNSQRNQNCQTWGIGTVLHQQGSVMYIMFLSAFDEITP